MFTVESWYANGFGIGRISISGPFEGLLNGHEHQSRLLRRPPPSADDSPEDADPENDEGYRKSDSLARPDGLPQ